MKKLVLMTFFMTIAGAVYAEEMETAAIAGAVYSKEVEAAYKIPAPKPEIAANRDPQARTTVTPNEKELIVRWAINDFLLKEKLSKNKVPGQLSFSDFAAKPKTSCMDKCIELCDGNGSGACYASCKAEGWSFSYCHDRCGGVAGCYETCKNDGWPFSYCHGKCGMAVGCYKACKADNWPFAYCKDRCGKAADCYEVCKADGWPFSYCNDACK